MTVEQDVAAGAKRARDEEAPADGAAAEEGTAKRLKVEGEDQAEEPADNEEEEAGDAEQAADGAAAKMEEAAEAADVGPGGEDAADDGGADNDDTAEYDVAAADEMAEEELQVELEDAAKDKNKAEFKADEPQKIGYKTFQSGKEAAEYFKKLLQNLTKNQDLNEYEFHNVLELIKKGHPEPDRKLGTGVRAIRVREHPDMDSVCFFLLRGDGSLDDVSVYKCIHRLFPGFAASRPQQTPGGKRRDSRGGRGGRGGGRGDFGRGRGGRGGGFPRGGGRRGGGRGRRGRH